MTKKIFISYSNEDIVFKNQFTNQEIFLDIIGADVVLFDYKEKANFGAILPYLKDQIKESSAIVLLISKSYVQSNYSLSEFWEGLDLHARKNLVFVPVMIDSEARGWWRNQKKDGSLRNLVSDDYAYVTFINSTGGPLTLITDKGVLTQHAKRVTDLAILVRNALEPDASPPPLPSESPVVVLGHPQQALLPNVQQSKDELAIALLAKGKPTTVWHDRWAQNANDAARPDADRLLNSETVFVQPLGEWDAQMYAMKPEIVRESLAQLAGKPVAKASALACPIVLWLPSDLSEPSFDKAQPVKPTVISRKTPSDLASELGAGSGPAPELPVIMLEEFDNDPELRTALHEGFRNVVSGVTQRMPEKWGFVSDPRSRLLEDLMKLIPGDKAVIAVHDLNLGNLGIVKDPKKIRTALENKLMKSEERVREVEEKLGLGKLQLFWSTIIYQYSDQLPWVLYPTPRLEHWHLLRFLPETNAIAVPEPSGAAIFRSYLEGWIRKPVVAAG